MKVIFSIIFIMSGLAFLARYLYLIKKCSIRVSAVIIDIEIHNDSRNKHIYPTYRYKIEHWWYTAKSNSLLVSFAGISNAAQSSVMEVELL